MGRAAAEKENGFLLVGGGSGFSVLLGFFEIYGLDRALLLGLPSLFWFCALCTCAVCWLHSSDVRLWFVTMCIMFLFRTIMRSCHSCACMCVRALRVCVHVRALRACACVYVCAPVRSCWCILISALFNHFVYFLRRWPTTGIVRLRRC